jgi:hypothetical protein
MIIEPGVHNIFVSGYVSAAVAAYINGGALRLIYWPAEN